MQIGFLKGGVFTRAGSVTMDEKGKVNLSFEDSNHKKFFGNIYYGDRTYTPKDGVEYMKKLTLSFITSSHVILRPDDEDTWFDFGELMSKK